jgi:hypothetical protein
MLTLMFSELVIRPKLELALEAGEGIKPRLIESAGVLNGKIVV